VCVLLKIKVKCECVQLLVEKNKCLMFIKKSIKGVERFYWEKVFFGDFVLIYFIKQVMINNRRVPRPYN